MSYFLHLYDIVYKTEQSRFVSARRMARSKIASKVVESFLSASIIAISLIALIGDKDKDTSDMISVITIILSTFLLVISLLFSYLEYDKRYEKYMSCAMELGEIHREMDMLKETNSPLNTNDEKALLDKYNAVLHRYDINHTSFDYQYYMASQNESACKIWWWIRFYILDVAFLYWMIAFIPLMAILWYCIVKIM